MAYHHEFLLVFTLMGFHSVCSLVEIDATPTVLSCKKCPPGFLSFCKQNQSSLCLPCEEGTYSENPSRRSACKPCSSCLSNEFESQSCTSTSNVKCKECSKCPPGFWEVKPCGGARDTVCEECPQNGKAIMSYASVQCNEVGIEDHLTLNKRKESDKAKSSLTIIEKEIPWSDDKRKPKHHDDKFTVEKQHLNVTASSLGFPSRDQAPSSSLSTKANGATTQMTFSSHSVVLVSPSVEASSISVSGLPKSISPSLAPTVPSKRRSPPPPPNVPRTKQTAKTRFDAITKEPSSYEMQGDEGDIPSKHTRSTDQFINITAGSSKQRAASSVSPSKHVVTVDMFDLNARGVVEGHTSTEFNRHHTLSGTVLHGEMPVPTNTNKSKLSRQSRWGIIAVATGVVTVVAVVLLGVRWRQYRESKGCFFRCPRPNCRRPRCPAASDCCDGTSVSSVAASYAEQNQMGNPVDHGLPVTVTIEHESDESPPSSNPVTQHTFLPSERTVVVADVHRDTVFNLFNLREQVDSAARSHLKYITRAETTINSSGGKLSSPDSDISIIVDSGAVREGINQPFSFHVLYDETSLLQDLPEGPDRTLISPVFHCGPDNISLQKPVEIIVPHCLYLEEVKKESISVYRCDTYSEDGPLKWEKVPSASEKNSQSKAWYTVKKDSVHIKTKSFSFWSIFLCGGGGSKRKRATVFANQPNEQLDTICYRFYIYSDNEDSKKRVRIKDRELSPNSKQMNEVPFKMYNDTNDITVRLTDLEEGWQMDKTPETQTYTYETAYHNGFRTYTSCEFAVKPCQQIVEAFSGNVIFQQEEHPLEHTIYLKPVFMPITPRKNSRRFSVSNATATSSPISIREEDEGIDDQENKPSSDFSAGQLSNHSFSSLGSHDEPVTQSHCHCIGPLVGGKWKNLLRNLGVAEVPTIENVDKNYCHETVEEKCYQGLTIWMRSCGTQTATTKTLCDALRTTRCTEALEALSKAGVSCVPHVSIPESTTDQQGPSVSAAPPDSHPCKVLHST